LLPPSAAFGRFRQRSGSGSPDDGQESRPPGGRIPQVSTDPLGKKPPMGKPAVHVLYVAAMAAVVVCVDVLFFRDRS
jgi:hypothetical protein